MGKFVGGLITGSVLTLVGIGIAAAISDGSLSNPLDAWAVLSGDDEDDDKGSSTKQSGLTGGPTIMRTVDFAKMAEEKKAQREELLKKREAKDGSTAFDPKEYARQVIAAGPPKGKKSCLKIFLSN